PPQAGGDEQTVAVQDTTPVREAPPEEEAVPARIYYDLTRHDWYAHGEPLILADDTYAIGSGLYAAPASDMRRIGEYEGVDAYALAGDDSTVYVPVYPGYWQPFRRSNEQSPR
ncbi:MAG: hypothetical protein ACRELX_08530, partial [Longimicrobiales bacterium]